ncbi:hypothetical protein HK102_007400, partial [Quaeritorhiza haematococci]
VVGCQLSAGFDSGFSFSTSASTSPNSGSQSGLSSSSGSAQLANFVACVVFYLLTNSTQASWRAYKDVQFRKFVERVVAATSMSAAAVIISLKYIHRLTQRLPLLNASSGSEYRILTTGLMLADAFLNDNAFTCKSWSEVTGISAQECATMKREFLSALQFDLSITEEEYAQWLQFLEHYLRSSLEQTVRQCSAPASVPVIRATSPSFVDVVSTTAAAPTVTVAPLAAPSHIQQLFPNTSMPIVIPQQPAVVTASLPSHNTFSQSPASYQRQSLKLAVAANHLHLLAAQKRTQQQMLHLKSFLQQQQRHSHSALVL